MHEQTGVVSGRDASVAMAGLGDCHVELTTAQQGPPGLWAEGQTCLRAKIGPCGGIWEESMVIVRMMLCTFGARVWLAWG